jgi:hypothetical protein
VAPLRLGGRRGKQSTPRVWLGGTGERSRSASGSAGQGKERGVTPVGLRFSSFRFSSRLYSRYLAETPQCGIPGQHLYEPVQFSKFCVIFILLSSGFQLSIIV